MLEWFVPLCFFWAAAAAVLGSGHTELHGGNGPKQIAGLVISLVLFLALWGVLRLIVPDGFVAQYMVSTAITLLAYPVLAWVAFKVVGVRLQHAESVTI